MLEGRWGGGREGGWTRTLTSTVMTSTRTAAELLAEEPPRHSTTFEMLRCPMSNCMYLPEPTQLSANTHMVLVNPSAGAEIDGCHPA